MTTADIVFAQPGNPDRLRDYEQDARTVFWALLAAILIHLLVAFLLAAFSGFFSPSLPAPEKPVELTFMDLSPASMVSKNSAFIETDESKKAPEPTTASSQAQSAYRRQKERNHIAGNISNRGISSVNALGTPLGRYQKIVADSIGSRWYTYVDQKRYLINIGTLRLRFVIDRS